MIEVGEPGANSTWFSDYGDIDCMQISADDSRPACRFSTYAYGHCLILEGRPREAVCYAHKSDKFNLRVSRSTQTHPSTQQPVSTLWPIPQPASLKLKLRVRRSTSSLQLCSRCQCCICRRAATGQGVPKSCYVYL